MLDTVLPSGMPANSFVLFSGEEGIRHRGLQTELIWRALKRGEPCIIVSFVDAPVAIIEEFLSLGWNVLPFLEAGSLQIIDCFTNRLREKHRTPPRQTDWNAYFGQFLDEVVTTVRDPTNLREIETKLHEGVESLEMVGSGVIVIDSINEASTQSRKFRTQQFIAETRTDICKQLFVPIVTSTTRTEEENFSEDYGHVFDGIIDLQHNDQILQNVRLKELSIRKMDGVQHLPDWIVYEYTRDRGFIPFDPHTEFNRVYHPQPEQSKKGINTAARQKSTSNTAGVSNKPP